MTERNTLAHAVTELQQAILDLVWSRGSATADEIREGLLPKRRLKDATVRTLLRRLEERGFLRHHVEGKTFVYRAAVRRRSVAVRAVRHIIERFWAGSAEQFLVGMVDEKVLSADALERLAKKIRER